MRMAKDWDVNLIAVLYLALQKGPNGPNGQGWGTRGLRVIDPLTQRLEELSENRTEIQFTLPIGKKYNFDIKESEYSLLADTFDNIGPWPGGRQGRDYLHLIEVWKELPLLPEEKKKEEGKKEEKVKEEVRK